MGRRARIRAQRAQMTNGRRDERRQAAQAHPRHTTDENWAQTRGTRPDCGSANDARHATNQDEGDSGDAPEEGKAIDIIYY